MPIVLVKKPAHIKEHDNASLVATENRHCSYVMAGYVSLVNRGPVGRIQF